MLTFVIICPVNQFFKRFEKLSCRVIKSSYSIRYKVFNPQFLVFFILNYDMYSDSYCWSSRFAKFGPNH